MLVPGPMFGLVAVTQLVQDPSVLNGKPPRLKAIHK
jgi:hypothetical protein